MKRRGILVFAAVVLVSLGARAAGRVVLAVPARHMLIDLAFDLAGMFPRDLDIVCYSRTPGGATRLEFFDRTLWRWRDISAEEWRTGKGLRPRAERLIMTGEDDLARELADAAAWARRTQSVDGRRPHEVANAVHRELYISRQEWEKLARAYGFKIEDRNVEVRRHGRYGPPGARRVGPAAPPAMIEPAMIEPAAVPAVAPAEDEPAAVTPPAAGAAAVETPPAAAAREPEIQPRDK
jgi:hypothetical protein